MPRKVDSESIDPTDQDYIMVAIRFTVTVVDTEVNEL